MSKIICGNCNSTHADVATVKECYASRHVCEYPVTATDTLVPPTEKQINFIRSLLEEKDVSDEYRQRLEAKIGVTLDKAGASKAIEWLMAQPKAAAKVEKIQTSVPEGRYALLIDDQWKFFTVQFGRGAWVGHVFVKIVTGGPGDWQTIKMPRTAQKEFLSMIEKDPRQAAIDFGLHTGSCGVCGSPLTNEESVSYGIGPVCRAKTGW